MDVLYTIFVTLIALGTLIVFHEWGHFWVARRCGVKVLRFSIGFGKPLLRWTDKQHTEYVIAAIPLGGYVKMLDERNDVVAESELSSAFNRQSLIKRIAIVAAGPIANFILAVVFFYVLFLGGVNEYRAVVDHVKEHSLAQSAGIQRGDEIIALNNQALNSRQALSRALLDYYGESQIHLKLTTRNVDTAQTQDHSLVFDWRSNSEASPLALLGIELYVPKITTELAQVLRHSPAQIAGMQVGDKLHALDQQVLEDWSDWVEVIRQHPDKPMQISVERDGKIIEFTVTPNAVKVNDEYVGQLGILPRMQVWPETQRVEKHYSLLSAWSPALRETADKTGLTLAMLKKMFVGQISVKQIGGPVSIAQQASLSSKLGWQAYLGLLALLSISLGVLNLLPIPVLDGGHLCFYLIEALRGKPLSDAVQGMAMQVGALLVFGFMLFAIYNDITRL